MDSLDVIRSRHSVRQYKHQPIPEDLKTILQESIVLLNESGHLHIQLVTDEPRAFSGFMSYGKFKGVENYLVMAGKKSEDLDERVGYYGELLVLLAQSFGLNTCWVGLSYRKVQGAYNVGKDEKLVCLIALGYGETQGVSHKIKSVQEVSNASDITPAWFKTGVEAALLAPTAVNQQKFSFEYLGMKDNKHVVKADKTFSLVGYTKIDLGIAKCHFEIGADKDNFIWA